MSHPNSRIVNLDHNLIPAGAHQALAAPVTAGNVSAISGYAVPAGSVYVRVQCTAGAAATTADGSTTPTASVGHLWLPLSERLMRTEEWAKTKVIRVSDAPVFQVQHYRL